MRVSRLALAALALCAVILTACMSGFSPTNRARVSPQYSASEFHYVAGNGSLWVVINGNPFRFHDKYVSDQIARRAMRGAHFGPRVNFVAYRPSGLSENYRVVLFYYAPPSFGGTRLCSGVRRPRPEPPIGNYVTVLAAFCRGDQRLTEVRGTTLAFRPDDPRFTEMIRNITYRLFPRDEPSRRNDS